MKKILASAAIAKRKPCPKRAGDKTGEKLTFQMLHQNGGHVLQGSLGADRADIVGHHRHAVYNARFFVLANGVSAFLAHPQKTVCAVSTHAGHNNAHFSDSYILGNGVEKAIHGWAMAANFFAGVTFDRITAGDAHYFHLKSARSD